MVVEAGGVSSLQQQGVALFVLFFTGIPVPYLLVVGCWMLD